MVEEWMRDTSQAALQVFLDINRRMSEGDRIARVFEMIEVQQSLVESAIRSHYPDADDREVFLRVIARRLDRDCMMRAYGWDPLEHP